MSRTEGNGSPEGSEVEELLEQLETLEEAVDSREARQEVRQAILLARRLPEEGSLFDEHIRKYTTRDMAEAFVGAIIFSIPLLVEDGVFDIAGHFVAVSVLGIPVFLIANTAFIVFMTYGLIYWTDIQRVHINRPILGLVPRRLVGVLLISFLTVAAMMTMWGRLGNWADPLVAIVRIDVVWTVAAFGAALGDILPGESAGKDIADVVDQLG